MQETQDTLVWSLGGEKSPGEENGNPLQYSCLETPMDKGAWRAPVHRVANSWPWLSRCVCHNVKWVIKKGQRAHRSRQLVPQTIKSTFCSSLCFFSGGSVVKNPPASAGKQQMQVWSLGWEDPLEEEMEPNPVFLPGKIAWPEEPGGLQSMGSQRVGGDWASTQPVHGGHWVSICRLSGNSVVIIVKLRIEMRMCITKVCCVGMNHSLHAGVAFTIEKIGNWYLSCRPL